MEIQLELWMVSSPSSTNANLSTRMKSNGFARRLKRSFKKKVMFNPPGLQLPFVVMYMDNSMISSSCSKLEVIHSP